MSYVWFDNAAAAAGGGGITYVGAGAGTSAATSITPALPSGWQENDIFITSLLVLQSAKPSTPSGWTLKLTQEQVGGFAFLVYYRRAVSGDTAPTYSSAQTMTAYTVAYRGAYATGDPFEATGSNNVSDASLTVTGITTLTNGSMVISTTGGLSDETTHWDEDLQQNVGDANANATPTVTAGMATTSRSPYVIGVNTSSSKSVAFWSDIKASAGGTGNQTTALASAPGSYSIYGALLALKPA